MSESKQLMVGWKTCDQQGPSGGESATGFLIAGGEAPSGPPGTLRDCCRVPNYEQLLGKILINAAVAAKNTQPGGELPPVSSRPWLFQTTP